jgi:hypothetical protein
VPHGDIQKGRGIGDGNVQGWACCINAMNGAIQFQALFYYFLQRNKVNHKTTLLYFTTLSA